MEVTSFETPNYLAHIVDTRIAKPDCLAMPALSQVGSQVQALNLTHDSIVPI